MAHQGAAGRPQGHLVGGLGELVLGRPWLRHMRSWANKFGVSGERGARGRSERDGIGDRWGIRPVGIHRRPCRCSGRCSGGQTEIGEDLGNHGGMFDGGDDLQGAAATQGHCSMSISNAVYESPPWLSRFGPAFAVQNRSRRFCEQPGLAHGADATGGRTSPWSAEGVLALTGTFGQPGTGALPAWRPEDGMMSGRSLALGASAPWKRMQPWTGIQRARVVA